MHSPVLLLLEHPASPLQRGQSRVGQGVERLFAAREAWQFVDHTAEWQPGATAWVAAMMGEFGTVPGDAIGVAGGGPMGLGHAGVHLPLDTSGSAANSSWSGWPTHNRCLNVRCGTDTPWAASEGLPVTPCGYAPTCAKRHARVDEGPGDRLFPARRNHDPSVSAAETLMEFP